MSGRVLRAAAASALLVPAALAWGTAGGAAADDAVDLDDANGAGGSRQVFTLADPRIDESSGLVDRGATMVTTNDSGSDPVLFVLDGQGRTTGVTTYAASTVDVEALAAGRDDRVWVGDIGDNRRERDVVTVHDVEVRSGDRTVEAPAYDLAYPDGPHDAESLLVGPDGRLLVITKALFGGQVYAAPRRLDPDRTNRLEAVGRVAELATDAALTRDGQHALVRGPGEAGVYALPSWERLATLPLPAQPQGEAVSVGPGGRVRVSSEGAGTPVWQVALPAEVRTALRPPEAAGSGGAGSGEAASGEVSGDAAGEPADGTGGASARASQRVRAWIDDLPGGPAALAGAVTLLVVAGSGVVLARRGRRRR